jgi:hypothetical protein
VKKSAKLSDPLSHVTMNCPWRTRSRIQLNCMSILFVRRGVMVSLAIPTTQELSQSMDVGCWGYPRLWRMLRNIAPSRPAMKSVTISV